MTTGLLLVHAFPLDARMWEPQHDTFDPRLPVVAPDLPGFGGAPPAGDVMSMVAGAERCLDALDRAGVDDAIVCGLSMGGYVALELWRRAADRVAGFVLANTRAGADTEEAAAGRRTLADRLRAEGSGFMLEQPPKLLSDAAPPALRERVLAILADQPATSIAAASLGMAERPDSTPDLASIAVPTVVVTSDADGLIPSDLTTPMADQIPGAELVVIEGAGHLSNLERPAAFDKALGGLIDRVLGGA
jgi:pimeloyl-ACP methyl ester carboxylesterase